LVDIPAHIILTKYFANLRASRLSKNMVALISFLLKLLIYCNRLNILVIYPDIVLFLIKVRSSFLADSKLINLSFFNKRGAETIEEDLLMIILL
jgi:hypothetical protein